MKLAFCLFKYFPFGGLQSDFLGIAQECQQRGNEIHVFTRSWQGDCPENFHLNLLPSKLSFTNLAKDRQYIQSLTHILRKNKYDAVIGFNKIPHLDVYFASDSCYAQKISPKSLKSKMISRHKNRLYWESCLFSPPYPDILFITKQQQSDFFTHYDTQKNNVHVLPPGIDENLKKYKNSPEYKQKLLQQLDLPKNSFLILMVGSAFRTKGLDRSILALASIKQQQNIYLVVVGKGKQEPFVQLAQKYGVSKQIKFLGVQKDVASLYLGADLLLHPSYTESAGKVLLEATILGLPILTTANCGYAYYIEKANNGIVIPMPFCQEKLNKALQSIILNTQQRQLWQENGEKFGKTEDLYSQYKKAADVIEMVAKRNYI